MSDNDIHSIVSRSARAFTQLTIPVDRIEELCRLTGVSVPVASAILTVFDPDSYAVIDFRSIRALAAARPQLLNTNPYQRFARYGRWITDYRDDPRVYQEYLDEVRDLAQQEDLTPREVDMALWMYDKDNS